MKYILTILFASLGIAGAAQNKNTNYSRSTDDDGKTLKLTLKIRNDTTSKDFERMFNVSGLTRDQKNDLINHVIDSLGWNQYFKSSSSSTTSVIDKAFSPKGLIELALNDYLDAFYLGDTLKIARSFSPAIVKYGYSRRKDSTNYLGMAMSRQQMVDYALRVKSSFNAVATEKLVRKVEVLDYLDQTASGKVTAWWGTDYILLAKQNGQWMISHVLWQSPPPVK